MADKENKDVKNPADMIKEVYNSAEEAPIEERYFIVRQGDLKEKLFIAISGRPYSSHLLVSENNGNKQTLPVETVAPLVNPTQPVALKYDEAVLLWNVFKNLTYIEVFEVMNAIKQNPETIGVLPTILFEEVSI